MTEKILFFFSFFSELKRFFLFLDDAGGAAAVPAESWANPHGVHAFVDVIDCDARAAHAGKVCEFFVKADAHKALEQGAKGVGVDFGGEPV